ASLPGVQAVAAGAIVVACVVLVSLFAGVLLMQSRGPRSPEVLPPEQTAEAEPEVERDISTGDRRLDALVERLAIGDASVIESMAPGVLLTDVDTQTGDQRRVTPGEWTVNLAG